MKSELQSCPGDSLTSFLKHIAYDLKARRIEYLIIAYFNENGFPLRMRQVTGRTSWVGYSIAEIISEAEALQAKGVCLVHNHPVSIQQKPALEPSEPDIEFQKRFLAACSSEQLKYLGCWIVSKGQINEILHFILRSSPDRVSLEDNQEISSLALGLTPDLIQIIEQIIKPLIALYDWHTIGSMKNVKHDSIFYIKTQVIYYPGKVKFPTPRILLTLKKGETEITEVLSLEEASRACFGLLELGQEANRLVANKSTEEYLEGKLFVAENVKFGFYILRKAFGILPIKFNDAAFINIRNTTFFMDMDGFERLHGLLSEALDKLESLSESSRILDSS